MAKTTVYGHCPDKKLATAPPPVFSGSLTLAEALEVFIEAQRSARCKPGTIEAQRIVIQQLVDFGESQDWPTIDQLTYRHLRRYMNYLQTRPRWFGRGGDWGQISPAYYDTVYRRLRRFFNQMVAEDEMATNPMTGIDRPKVPDKIIPIVSDEDKAKLLAVSNPRRARTKYEHFQMTRNTAMLWVFFDTSARKAGITSCQVDDLDLEAGTMLVTEKFDKPRYLFLDRVTLKALRQYLAVREKLNPRTDDLWVNGWGRRMKTDWIRKTLIRLGDRAGVKGLHPHKFRHTFITRMVEDNVSQTTIEHMCGVTRIPRTYLNKIGDRQAQVAHREFSPAAKLARKLGRAR